MKTAVILHGTNATPNDNWFPWLAKQLEQRGYSVWIPQLPGADYPDSDRYNEYLLKNNPWDFTGETIFIGHSSGTLAALRLLEAFPGDTRIKAVYMVCAFKDDLNWKDENGKLYVGGLFKTPYDFKTLRKKAGKYILIHSNDDPYCPLPHASYLAVHLDGELLIQVGQKHFSVETMGERYREFPFLLEQILQDSP